MLLVILFFVVGYLVYRSSGSLGLSGFSGAKLWSAIRGANPRSVVAVYIPEYVVGRWWEQLLHNQTALRLKIRLFFRPNTVVIDVPYHLRTDTSSSR